MHLHDSGREVCIKATSLPFKGQVTKQTTVKRSFETEIYSIVSIQDITQDSIFTNSAISFHNCIVLFSIASVWLYLVRAPASSYIGCLHKKLV